MKRILKWAGIVVGSLLVLGFFSFLYFIPPFDFIPPEEFTRQTVGAAPSLDNITNPVERAIAERGKYIVTTLDCSGCHTPAGDEGPNWSQYLGGGSKSSFVGYQTYISRNLTPDKENGLGRRTDEEVKRVLRSGLLPEGRVAHYRDMPWAFTANLTDEDRHAVVVYLRHLKPVARRIPDPMANESFADTSAAEMLYTLDYGIRQEKK
jgi:hypothetical protein